ncbi:MAG TPA: T9SS type A sorting domain-containing protein [Chitinophagales bacterium]|nr:T9SS type A sorting domain-containing protein [Chitinophagales bacterium]
MKQLFTILFSLFVSNYIIAQNWVKYDVSNQNIISPIGNCYKLSNGLIDSIDLDCASTIQAMEFALIKNPSLQEFEMQEILQYYPNLKTITFKFNSNIDSISIEELPEQIKYLNISNILNKSAFISINGNGIDSMSISTNSRDLYTYQLPENLKSIFINNAYFSTGMSSDTLNVNMTEWPKNLVTFLSERTLAYCNETLPASLQNFGTRYTLENYVFINQLLNKNKNLPNFNLLTLYSNNDYDEFDLSLINHIKRLSIAIPENHILGDGFLGVTDFPKNLEYLKIDKINTDFEISNLMSLKTLHVNQPFFKIENLLSTLPTLDTLRLSNISSASLPPLPTQLKHLQLSQMPNLSCIPSFPNTMRSFEGDQLGNVQCIPNETPWIKSTEEWPLCTDANKVCNPLDQMMVSGTVYIDVNNNNVIDPEDIIARDIVVEANGVYSSTFKDGQYHLILHEPGTYNLELHANYDNVLSITPANAQAIVNTNQPNDTIDFLIQLKNEVDVEIIGTNSVARPGMNTQLSVFVKNRNVLPALNSTVKILYPSSWTGINILPSGYSISNDTIIWSNISISSFGSENFGLSGTLPPTATILGDEYQYEMWVENEEDVTPENNYYSITDTIIGSYDPNDKIVNYSSLSPDLSNTAELIYTIRFQNTGTDTAFKVVVIDTIVGNLDPTSIRIIGSSHDFEWDFTGQGIATFVFDNILLPDSNVNEAASHGFVTLAVRPNQDLAAGDSISNRAGIYFDYNEPVITNTASTKITTVTSIYTRSSIPLSIYPNPAKNQVRVEWNTTEPAILRLADITGKIITTKRLSNGFTEINVSQLPKGIYIIQLESGQDMAVSKLIVQ